MSNQVILLVERLKSAIGTRDPRSASITIDLIIQYFDGNISQNEAELAVKKIFDDTTSVIGFMNSALKTNKIFKTEIIKVFELLKKVIEAHTQIVKQYAKIIIKTCLKFLQSHQASAFEREKAVTVIHLVISKNLYDEVNREFINELLRILKLTNLQATVQGKLFELIGRLSKDYPEYVGADCIEIQDTFLKTLENLALNQLNVQNVAVVGAINGLNDLLECFTPSNYYKETFTNRLYKCLKMISTPTDAASNKSMHRSALTLLTNRCEYFSSHLYKDFFHWHQLLVDKWLNMKWDDRLVAIQFLHGFYREIAKQLMELNVANHMDVLTFMKNHFERILESEKSQPFEVRLAIIGIGLLAAPCSLSPTSRHSKEILRQVMQRIENAANEISDKKEKYENISDYVESLSKIIEFSDELSGIELSIIQNIIISLIRNFHLLSTRQHSVTVNTLKRTFFNLSRLGDTMIDDILETVIYQGIIWTCSHKLPIDAQNDWQTVTDWKDQITFQNYLPLWNGFLAEVEQTEPDQIMISGKIFDHMMRTLFKILDKLDLSTTKRVFRNEHGTEMEAFFCDPNYNLVPKRPKDFHIFFNLVDLYRSILKSQTSKIHLDHFVKWINIFMETIMTKSLHYPLVSGFVKLMQIALSIANRLDYFNDDMVKKNYKCYDMVCHYLSVTIRKAQECSGELQLTCLTLLLTAPAAMLQKFINEMIPVFSTALELGKSNQCFFIAGMALKALKRYVNLKDPDNEEFLRMVLPNFGPYLQGFKNEISDQFERKRATKKLVRINDNDLLKFQKDILLFLGTLEPEYSTHLLHSDENINLVKWNTTEVVSVTLFGSELQPDIFMDPMLPRIREIIMTATDRQKKITACEIVQATILYLMGTNNNRDHLWSELCDLMLRLGCDTDVGVQQIFEPLAMQIMHFMSRNDQINQAGAEILLDSLMTSISHPSSLVIRDLSARCLREFFVWTIKQSTPQQLHASPFNIITLIKRLKLLNCDTLHQNRFGAALAFNNIYQVLREEEFIVNVYWLDLFHDFCINFKMSEQYLDENLNCQTNLEQVSASLDHVLRVLKERKQIFNTSNEDRIKPIPFQRERLKDAVMWMLDECKSVQHEYRAKVMSMFLQLAPCVEGFNSAANFVRDTQTTETMINLCEYGTQNDPFDEQKLSFNKVYAWLMGLQSSLDCYIWAIVNGFLADAPLNKCRIFKAIQRFLDDAMNMNFFNRFCSDEMDMQPNIELRITEVEKINVAKSQTLLLVFKFLNTVMPLGCIPTSIWESKNIVVIMENTLFSQQLLECDVKDSTFLKKLLESVETFIVNLNRYASIDFKKQLNNQLMKECWTNYKCLIENVNDFVGCTSIAKDHLNHMKGVESIYKLNKLKKIEFSMGHDIDAMAEKGIYSIFDSLREQMNDEFYAKSPSPDALQFVSHLLRICFLKEDVCNKIIDLILNTSELRLNSMKTINHGKYFLNLFKFEIFEYLMKQMDTTIERLVGSLTVANRLYIIRMLIELTEHASKHHANNLNQIKQWTNLLLSKWDEILAKTEFNGSENIITVTLIELMHQVAIICPFEISEVAVKAPGFENWLLKIISEPDVTKIKSKSEMKSKAISLLPCMLGATTLDNQNIQNALQSLQSTYFPLSSAEFRAGSIDRTIFCNMFQSILNAMRASKSPIMLMFLIKSSASDSNHIMGHKIQKTLIKFMLSLKSDIQMKCLTEVFKLFNDLQLNPSNRLSILRRYLLQMIRNSSLETIIQFYTLNLKEIDRFLKTDYDFTMSDYRLEQAFTTRIGALELLEVMVSILPVHHFNDTKSSIVLAIFPNPKSENELITWMSRSSFYVRTEKFETDNAKYKEWFRQYQCAAYKMISAIVSNIKTELKFYESFLLCEAPGKSIWRHLINTTDNNLYIGESMEVDQKPEVKERLLSIRSLKPIANEKPRKYIESQNIFESSLSQDVTKIDLSYSSVRSTNEVLSGRSLMDQSKKLHLEKNSVNDHEIMATVCGVIDHIFENEITPYNTDGTARRAVPKWVKNICDIIEDESIHKNIKFFLITVIDNCRQWFRLYAPAITKTILKFCTTQSGIGSLLIFMSVNLLEWDSLYRIDTEDEKRLASDLIKILMETAWHDRRDIFRRNLELIRNLIEKWHELILLPRQLLYDSIRRNNDGASRENTCGIQLNGIVLANGLIPWTDSTLTSFLRSLDKCLDNDSTAVYQSASQVLGMALNEIYIKQNMANDESERYMDALNKRLEQWYRGNQTKFLHIIYGIHKHYEPIVDKFLTRISSLISTSMGGVKNFYLEMFLARINSYDTNIFREVMAINIKELLKSNVYQLIALHIVNKTLPKMNVNEIKEILLEIVALKSSKSAESRDLIFEILIYIREHCQDNDLRKTASSILLTGLNDPDENIQVNIFNYWMRTEQLPVLPQQRILYLFKHLYDHESKEHFLQYCVQFLLEPAIKSSESQHKIIKYLNLVELDDTKYTEYDINVNLKSQNNSLRIPLFIESQQQSIESGEFDPTKQYLRATMNTLGFDATIDPSTLHQSSQSFSLQTQNALSFDIAPQMLDRRSQRMTSQEQNIPKSSFNHLRERILRNKDELNRVKALNAQRQNEYKKVKEQQKHKRDHAILYRRYRFGDYPDFFINTRAFLLPLQALVKHDAILGRHAFIAIINAIFKKLEEEQQQPFIDEFQTAVQCIFAETNHCESMLFSAITELTYTNSLRLDIDPNVISTISNANDMLIDGILLLEHRLASAQLSNDECKLHWLKLANIYYDVSEHDVVASIFSDKISSDTRLSMAMEMESNGDYSKALQQYSQLISSTQPILESDFIYQSVFNCYEVMGRWEDLDNCINDQINDVDELWTDSWNLQHLLRHHIQAKLRMLLMGSSGVPFIENMEQWLRNPKRVETIKKSYSEQLMMLYIANEDYVQAKVCAEQYFESFLVDWSNMNIFSEKIRFQKLLNVRRVAEVHGYADMLLKSNNDSTNQLAERWSNTQIKRTDSTQLWESLIAYRIYVAETILRQSIDDDNKNCAIHMISDLYFKIHGLALQQNNIEMSNTLLKRWQIFDRNHNAIEKCKLQLNLANVEHSFLKSKNQNKMLQTFLGHWMQLNELHQTHRILLATNPNLNIKVLTLMSDIAEESFEIVTNSESVDAALQQKIFDVTASSHSRDVRQRIFECPKNCLNEIIKLSETDDYSMDDRIIGESFNRLGMFCFRHLSSDDSDTEILIIKSILRGMRHLSKNAQLQFPRLFQLRSIERPDVVQIFNEEVNSIPLWTIIGWIPQIVSRFDFEKPHFLDDLLLKLATTYPFALVYTFQLSFEQFRKQQKPIFIRNVVQQILNKLKSPLVDKFINAMICLSLPEKVLENQLSKIRKNFGSLTQEQFINELEFCQKLVFENEIRGNLTREVRGFKSDFDNLMEMNVIEEKDQVREAVENLYRKILDVKSGTNLKISVFCPWLQEFHWAGGDIYIELFGQYNHNTKPDLNRCLKIIKFEEKVTVCATLRKPIRIGILASNGKKYHFLIKSGEDLRQDERIQQLQNVMSDLMQNDKNCNAQKLMLRTYKVIPLSVYCGAIGWIDNTDSVDNLLVNYIPNWERLRKQTRREFEHFMQKKGDKTDKILPNVTIATKYSRHEIIKNFQKLRSQMPVDSLHTVLYKISNTPECFFVLRNNFAKSLAVMCISHWILGIGDRHLANILIDKTNGELIGIDFNLAFGAATTNLRIPELIPFRLTPDFVNAMKPFKTSGIFKKCMEHTLRVLRAERKPLVACMEVFVYEPTIDWLEHIDDVLNSLSIEDRKMKLQQRIDTVDDKLAGVNPCRIIENNLKSCVYGSASSHTKGYIKLLREVNKNKAFPDKEMSIESQVECLMNIATDPCILGVSYVGQLPWV